MSAEALSVDLGSEGLLVVSHGEAVHALGRYPLRHCALRASANIS